MNYKKFSGKTYHGKPKARQHPFLHGVLLGILGVMMWACVVGAAVVVYLFISQALRWLP